MNLLPHFHLFASLISRKPHICITHCVPKLSAVHRHGSYEEEAQTNEQLECGHREGKCATSMEERTRSTRRSERLHEDTNRASQRGDNISCLLSSMQLMSAAICVQICTHLHPRDLLSVSRLNKAFHAFLLQKSSANLWERAMDTAVELPPCPSRVIEPAWLSLLYSPSCTVGGKLHSEHCPISN